MRGRLTLSVAATALIVAITYNAPSAQQRPLPSNGAQQPIAGDRQSQQAVLDKYCVTCHNQRVKTGGLALTRWIWQTSATTRGMGKVVRKIRTGAMPPVGRHGPTRPRRRACHLARDRARCGAAEHGYPGGLATALNRGNIQTPSRSACRRDRRRVGVAGRCRGIRIRQQRRRADILGGADRAISRSRRENQSDGAGAAARTSDAGNDQRADR